MAKQYYLYHEKSLYDDSPERLVLLYGPRSIKGDSIGNLVDRILATEPPIRPITKEDVVDTVRPALYLEEGVMLSPVDKDEMLEFYGLLFANK